VNALSVIRAVYYRTWLSVARRPVVLLLSLVQPLIWMSFFGFLFHRFPLGQLPADVSYLQYLLPGVCGMTVLLGASQSGIALIRDMQTGVLERMLSTPASRPAMLLGKVAADVSRLLVQAALVAMLGMLLGVRFHLPLGALLLAVAYLALFGAGYCCLSCWIALQTRSQESMAAFVHVANMPIFFTSTALVPFKQMPPWLNSIAAWNPLTLAIEPLREAMLFGTYSQALATLGVLALLATTLFVVAVRALRSQLEM
jgi:ABC-2 type transport system permease protein